MWPIATDEVMWCVCVRVCVHLLVMTVIPAKTPETTVDIPRGMFTPVKYHGYVQEPPWY